nr:histone-lysine N-methyltransferase PRDM7-like [Plodia interpunctella]
MDKSKLRKRKPINYYEPNEPSFDEYIYCENCYDFVFEYCAIHGPLLVIPDNKVTSRAGIPPWVPRAALTTPTPFLHIAPSEIIGAGLGVFSSLTLPRGVRFGPYLGKRTDDFNSVYCWQIRKDDGYSVVDGIDGEASNWMRYVNCARSYHEQNLVAFQYQGQIYYRTVKIIPKFTELLVFYGSEFAHALGIDLKNYNSPQKITVGANISLKNIQTKQNRLMIHRHFSILKFWI